MSWRHCRRLAGSVLCLLLLTGFSGSPAQARDWVTKGGAPERTSASTEPVGLVELAEAWRTEGLGESATQPVVIGRNIYHLAGAYLWGLKLAPNGESQTSAVPVEDPIKGLPIPFSQAPDGPVIAPQSTPTYSDETKILYFGTGYGWLWSYHTEEGWSRPAKLEQGCPVVGSPLVLRDQGRDIVIVADRPNYPEEIAQPDGRPLCPRNHGRVWVVRGLDSLSDSVDRKGYESPSSKSADGGFGGFITPSAVPTPAHNGNPSFIIGADGFEGGRAIRLAIDRSTGYTPYPVWTVDGSAGFAGNFTSDGTSAYWLDTEGHLWGVDLGTGLEPNGWPGYAVNLPAQIGATRAFTNTEPAVEVRQTPSSPETHLYVTLRNQTEQPGGHGLRDGPTGSDGAVVALGPGGQVKWHRRFGPADRLGEEKASLNTAPLALLSRGALFFGDVNGHLYSYALDTGNPTGGDPRTALVRPGERSPSDRLFLLNEGEQPARGEFTFSQVSGVGVDPVFANGLLLVGVNYVKDGKTSGRLVAYRAGSGYDLRWLGPHPDEPLALKLNEPAPIEGQLQLELTTRQLGELCDGPITVQWYLTDSAGQLIRSLGEAPLPPDLAPDQPHTVNLTATLTAADPEEGQIVGIIDLPSVQALGQAHPKDPLLQQARGIAAVQAMALQKTCSGAVAEVVEREGFPGPEGGLANNILRLPYARRAVVDDPFVARLAVPEAPVMEDRFEVLIYLGYRNNLGRSGAEVQLRLWARPSPGTPAPEGGWRTVTIDQAPCCTQQTGFFEGLGEGVWEVIAELRYPNDTDPGNNQLVNQVEIRKPGSVEEGGVEGGAISN